MKKTLPYTTDSLEMILLYLRNQIKQGRPRDFDIRIDDLVVVQRTSDISKFFLFKHSLTKSSNEVIFKIYKGKSRRYDKYLLERNANGSPDPSMTSQEYITFKVEEAIQQEKKEAKMAHLKQKTKTQKVKISALKKRVAELESKNTGDLQSLLQLASGYLNPSGKNNPEANLNGISNDDLIKMISHYREKYGEEVFGQALGVGLQIAEYPKIIEPVKEFINQKIEENEEK